MAGPCCKRSLKEVTRWMESLRPTMCTCIGDVASDGNTKNYCNVRILPVRASRSERRCFSIRPLVVRAANATEELIVLKNSVFGENRLIIRHRERPNFGGEGGGRLGRSLLLYRRYASHSRSVLTFGFNGPLSKNHRSQISEFFNKTSPLREFDFLAACARSAENAARAQDPVPPRKGKTSHSWKLQQRPEVAFTDCGTKCLFATVAPTVAIRRWRRAGWARRS